MILDNSNNQIYELRPYWYDSEEENLGSEYGSESSDDENDPVSVTWTNERAINELQDYLEDKLIYCGDLDDKSMVLGTKTVIENDYFVTFTLNISSYLKWGSLHTRHFGYLRNQWDPECPYDIMYVYKFKAGNFTEYRAIIKTYWIRLIQRHWKTHRQNGLKGLLSMYA